MQIAPTKELLPYIKHYLFLDSEVAASKKLRLFSDGNTGMVLTFRGNIISNTHTTTTLNYPNSFLYWQISTFRDLYLAEKTSIIIVVFQPYGFNHLLGISANEIREAIIATEDICGSKHTLLYEKLSEHSYLEKKYKF